MEKYNIRNKKIDIIQPEEQASLFEKTFRCPQCYKVPLLNLNLDLDTLLLVKATCECGTKEFEISDFLNIYNRDFRGNLQCKSCKDFATKNNTVYKYCLGCKDFYCGECQYDHLIKEEGRKKSKKEEQEKEKEKGKEKEKDEKNENEIKEEGKKVKKDEKKDEKKEEDVHCFIPFREVGSICPKHKKYYQAFCKKDKCLCNICKDCYGSHGGHKIVNFNYLYITDLELTDYNTNYGRVQLTVFIKDTETKETIHTLLKDVDELNKNYITELFDANKQKNQYILAFFKDLLTIYNNTIHKNYNVIMNVRNNIGFNNSSFELKIDNKMDENTLLNKFYLYSKNHCIAKKPKPFKEKLEKIDNKKFTIKTEMDDYYQEIIKNINLYLTIINDEDILLNDDIEVQIQSPFIYKSFIYFGEYMVDKLIPHGRGILIYKNGDRYYGNFENGKKNKLGIFYFKKNGAKYEGQWANNKMNGCGKYYYPNGTTYEGEFKENKRHGFGILKTSNGDEYSTIWKEGNIDNYGEIKYKNGDCYKGVIKNYKKEAYGRLEYSNGDVYEGSFDNDNMSFGKYTYKNGNSYYGYFQDNKMNGYGKFKNKKLRECYKGYFVNDKKHGIGRYFYKNGDIYNGYFFDDLRNGFGIIRYNNGDWYKGMFVKDTRHGIGIFYEKKGDEYYLGDWAEDKKEGMATIYNHNWSYQGPVKNGIKEGNGQLIYGDNQLYTGPFKNNMMEGYGTLLDGKEGKKHESLFSKGKKITELLKNVKESIATGFEVY
jgi:hypothetical protein